MFGYDDGWALLGRDHRMLIAPHEWARLDAQTRATLDPRAIPGRAAWEAVRRDGSPFAVEGVISRVPWKGSLAVLVTFVDLSEGAQARETLRQLQDQLRHAQKIAAMGRLASSAAHDFNNLLMVVAGRAHLLQSLVDPSHPARREVDVVRTTVERALALTRRLLAFNRTEVMPRTVLDLNAVVADMAVTLRRLLGEHIELVTVTSPTLGRVKADAGQIEQVILNLALNARDAMPHGGRLTLGTADVALDPAFVAVHRGAHAGPHVMLSVADTGVGMDDRTRSGLFAPFFTTKEEGKGTELGLFSVHGIVAEHEGYIIVESAPGRGAMFAIYLPRVEETPEPVAPTPASAQAG